MRHGRRRVVLFILIGFSLLIPLQVLHFVNAGIGETYSLTATPSRIQETYNPGVSLVLSVSNASVSTVYSFTWHVTDPSLASYTATNSTTTGAGQTSFVLSVVFPRSFTLGASTKYAGNYSASVDQSRPSPARIGVAKTSFNVALTDATSYQRTATMSISASSYKPSESVTVRFYNGTSPLPYYSALTPADATGTITYAWTIPPSAALGNNTVSLQGSCICSIKNPPDSQAFWIYRANVTITQLQVAPNPLQRTQIAVFSFQATYTYGTPVQSGSPPILLTESDGVTIQTVTAHYDSTLGEFGASYSPPLSGENGTWVATISANSFNDGYGNGGPSSNVVRGFTVQDASLTVSVSIPNNVYGPGDLVPIYATITTPNGNLFTSGTVTATMTSSAQQQGNLVSLTYDPSQGKWVGTFTVASNAPSGAWYSQVRAVDANANSGQGSTILIVNGSPQSFLFSSLFLIIVIIAAAGLVVAFLFWKRNNVFRAVLKVDLQAVSQEAKKVESQEFFRNIQDQIKREKMAERKDDG
jgi:hypothetical protein